MLGTVEVSKADDIARLLAEMAREADEPKALRLALRVREAQWREHELREAIGMSGWIGVDLDGTLARHGTGDDPPGAPVPDMVFRVKAWRALGLQVRIVTARVSSSLSEEQIVEQRGLIRAWCRRHLGEELPVTAEKDLQMMELWDDRVVAVLRDQGTQLSPSRFDARGTI